MADSENLFLPAQTNTALYAQLHQAGRSTDDLIAVRDAYRMATRLFNGRYRKTERAFLCHVVGAASSVARFDDRLTLTVAALLHAAYDSGMFPDGKIGGQSAAHRSWLRDGIGEETEALLSRWDRFDFEDGLPEQYAAEGFDPADRDCLLMALAHEVDDLADGGLVIAPKYGRSIEGRIGACIMLAEQIDQPLLAETLAAHLRAYGDFGWADQLQVDVLHGYHIAPNMWTYQRLRRRSRRGDHVKVH